MHFLNGGVVRAIPFPNRGLWFLMVSELLFDQFHVMSRQRKNGLRYFFLDGLFVGLIFLHLAEIVLIFLLKDEISLLFNNIRGFKDLLKAWALECAGPPHNAAPKVRDDGPRIMSLRPYSTPCTNQGS